MLLNTTPGQKWFTTVDFILEARDGLCGGKGGGGLQADWEQMTIAFVYSVGCLWHSHGKQIWFGTQNCKASQ